MGNRSTDANVRGTAGFLCPTGGFEGPERRARRGAVSTPIVPGRAWPGSAGKIRRVSGASAELSYIHPMAGSPVRRNLASCWAQRRLDWIGATAEIEREEAAAAAQQLNICSESRQIARVHVSGGADQRRRVEQ